MGRAGGKGQTQPARTVSPAAASARAAVEALGWQTPQARVEEDGESGERFMVNANGLGLVDRQKTVGWYTAVSLTRAEAETVAARADEISLLVANGGSELAGAFADMGRQHPAGAMLASMFGPRPGQAPDARLRVSVIEDGSLEVSEYDFAAWKTTLTP